MNRLRWREIALVTQSAMNAVNPVVRLGTQIVEVIREHGASTHAEAQRRAAALFEQVGLDPAWTRRYPHEFSGGMRQRAVIAMAPACEPSLIVADEPTTALDVIIQDEVFDLLARIREGGRHATLLMYAGQIVEAGPSEAVFARLAHPYTIGLQTAFADLGDARQELISLPGSPPSAGAHGEGCRFASRVL